MNETESMLQGGAKPPTQPVGPGTQDKTGLPDTPNPNLNPLPSQVHQTGGGASIRPAVEPQTQGLTNTKTPPVPFPQEPINKQGAAIQTAHNTSETHPVEAQDQTNQSRKAAPQQKQFNFPKAPVPQKSTAVAFDANAQPLYPGMRVKLVGTVVGVDASATHFDGITIVPLHKNIHDSRIGKEFKVDPSQLLAGE